eukprot:TRINITY_DN11942_c0_g1_i1.p1 TRINITY_DN11942_c0_g1~~TRINITY_DN11942_c0_g1_i1.p1  ORF type:complete len:1017 (+),score=175.41 TRINITY_DN11942_c0_g1_i1:287-3052(+)
MPEAQSLLGWQVDENSRQDWLSAKAKDDPLAANDDLLAGIAVIDTPMQPPPTAVKNASFSYDEENIIIYNEENRSSTTLRESQQRESQRESKRESQRESQSRESQHRELPWESQYRDSQRESQRESQQRDSRISSSIPVGVMSTMQQFLFQADDTIVGILQSYSSMAKVQPDAWMITPDSTARRVWVCIWMVCFAVDIWLTTFRLVFLSSAVTSWLLVTVDVVIQVFFFLDIISHFFTGIFENHMIVMNRRVIVKRYLRCEFWVDLLANVPLFLIQAELRFGVLRLWKLAFLLKMLRLSKYITMVKYSAASANSSINGVAQGIPRCRPWLVNLSEITKVAKPLLVFFVVIHIHATFWGLLQPRWEGASTVRLGLGRYVDSFWWAYSILTGGNPPAPTNVPSLRMLESVLLMMRIVLIGWLVQLLVEYTLIVRERDAHKAVNQLLAIKHLGKYTVSVETQMQVLNSLQEAASERKEMRRFEKLMDTEMPQELRRTIREEMRSPMLLRLELISRVQQLNDMFVPELAQQVREEVYASEVLVFKCGDFAHQAYCVAQGSVNVSNGNKRQPQFTEGMWLEEHALVKPGMHCRGTAVTAEMSTLLVVDAKQFAKLLDTLKLRETHEEICSREIWRGSCGRCGRLGDHFPHRCPLLSRGETKERLAHDLIVYLRHTGLHHLEQSCLLNNIYNLEQLKAVNYVFGDEIFDLDVAEAELLRPDIIGQFVERQATLMRDSICALRGVCKHCLFISHYKAEAGTEAALMRESFEIIMEEDGNRTGHVATQDSRFFLDSEDLVDLAELQHHVRTSENLLLILTPGVLTRPWVLVEIWTAITSNVEVVPVMLLKPGATFQIPGDDFYNDLLDGSILGAKGIDLLKELDISLESLVACIKKVFLRIASSYSPHRSKQIRDAELREILRKCNLIV